MFILLFDISPTNINQPIWFSEIKYYTTHPNVYATSRDDFTLQNQTLQTLQSFSNFHKIMQIFVKLNKHVQNGGAEQYVQQISMLCAELCKVLQSCTKLCKVLKSCTQFCKVVTSCAKQVKVVQSCEKLCKVPYIHLPD